MHDRYLKQYDGVRLFLWNVHGFVEGPGSRGFMSKIVQPALQANVELVRAKGGESRACAHEQMKRAWSKGMFMASSNSSIFSRFSKFSPLGLSKGEFSYLKTYFSYLTNNRKWTGKQNNIARIGRQLPGNALCLMSNLSAYVNPIIPAATENWRCFTEKRGKAATLSSRLWTQATHVRQNEPF